MTYRGDHLPNPPFSLFYWTQLISRTTRTDFRCRHQRDEGQFDRSLRIDGLACQGKERGTLSRKPERRDVDETVFWYINTPVHNHRIRTVHDINNRASRPVARSVLDKERFTFQCHAHYLSDPPLTGTPGLPRCGYFHFR